MPPHFQLLSTTPLLKDPGTLNSRFDSYLGDEVQVPGLSELLPLNASLTPSPYITLNPRSPPNIRSSMKSSLLVSLLLVFAAVSLAGKQQQQPQPSVNGKGGMGGLFGPGSGFNIPGFLPGMGGGYGIGYGGPGGGYAKGGTVRSTVVCRQKGPCFRKKLTCPAKCFTSFSRSGKGYGYGGGGGGCTIDCQNKCIAYC